MGSAKYSALSGGGIKEMTPENDGSLLEVFNLKTYFFAPTGIVKSVDGVNLRINRGESVGLVGETGAGKSQTAFSILRLVPEPGRIVDGKIIFDGRNLLELTEEEMRQIRGKEIAMIFQDPISYLNPYLTVKDQIVEAIRVRKNLDKNEARKTAVKMLEKLRISSPESVVDYYSHQLSGGMAQRIMIGSALSCNPSLLIADEPTTALDVTVQQQILDLLAGLRKELALSLLLITHDLAIIAEICDRVYVMYAGLVVENADILSLFEKPMHPYTQGLISSALSIDEFKEDLVAINGMMPDPSQHPSGCRFHPRCSEAKEVCKKMVPPTISIEDDHQVSCWLYG